MKKLVIASDIHGSAHWCRKLLERFAAESEGFAPGEVRLLLLGDVLYHGPRNDLPEAYAPKEVIAMLNPLREALFCVRGNCDGEVDQMVLDFPIMADYTWLDVNGLRIFATHGHLFGLQNPLKVKKSDILLGGHTHVPTLTKYDAFTYVNPASVSIPKEGSCHSYAVLEGRTFTWKNLQGEVYKTETV